MNPRQRFDLILLAALWGGSFMFMRYAAPAFGAFALVWLRVAIAAACLLPLLLWRGQVGILWENALAMVLLGVFSTALPFVLIAWAMLSLTSGLASILNATTPIFTALMAAWWLRDKLDTSRMLGLAIGFAGVLLLAADKAEFHVGGSGWALVAMLLATLFVWVWGKFDAAAFEPCTAIGECGGFAVGVSGGVIAVGGVVVAGDYAECGRVARGIGIGSRLYGSGFYAVFSFNCASGCGAGDYSHLLDSGVWYRVGWIVFARKRYIVDVARWQRGGVRHSIGNRCDQG